MFWFKRYKKNNDLLPHSRWCGWQKNARLPHLIWCSSKILRRMISEIEKIFFSEKLFEATTTYSCVDSAQCAQFLLVERSKIQSNSNEEEFNAQNFGDKLLCVCRSMLWVRRTNIWFRLGVSWSWYFRVDFFFVLSLLWSCFLFYHPPSHSPALLLFFSLFEPQKKITKTTFYFDISHVYQRWLRKIFLWFSQHAKKRKMLKLFQSIYIFVCIRRGPWERYPSYNIGVISAQRKKTFLCRRVFF